MGPSYSPYTPPIEGGGWQKSLLRLLNMGPKSQNWVPILPVWPMAPLPLYNEYQFPQLGPHWIGQSNCYSLDP
jgi:hypothetical protein